MIALYMVQISTWWDHLSGILVKEATYHGRHSILCIWMVQQHQLLTQSESQTLVKASKWSFSPNVTCHSPHSMEDILAKCLQVSAVRMRKLCSTSAIRAQETRTTRANFWRVESQGCCKSARNCMNLEPESETISLTKHRSTYKPSLKINCWSCPKRVFGYKLQLKSCPAILCLWKEAVREIGWSNSKDSIQVTCCRESWGIPFHFEFAVGWIINSKQSS